jgi:hypothetical protein
MGNGRFSQYGTGSDMRHEYASDRGDEVGKGGCNTEQVASNNIKQLWMNIAKAHRDLSEQCKKHHVNRRVDVNTQTQGLSRRD